MEALKTLKNMSIRQMLLQSLNFLLVLSSAFMFWKGLGLYHNTESPIVVVLSGSMEPAFYKGDILFLSNPKQVPIEIGDITVFKVEGRDIPIVHRVIRVHREAETNKQYLLTKGDNNEIHDRGLYNPGQMWVDKDDVVGRVKGYVPYVGMVTILLNEYPQVKFAVLGLMGIMIILSKE
ncbi:Signal peptidase complex catalytic subunit [Dimargaris verticillata]|uniref:Signal peptidase complex catalytic subunit SEC11 n=1 Tax=Dimargaris verticillata TaxID=2761393 RepID=A0A9W8EAU4_9FUNG|nr:Signal peptidase complex catalytic subunit [Dimargaris xerosporica]KAJ1984075.1 Signal peptidase complex catalytic subunit [Dimargaris verticillata]